MNAFKNCFLILLLLIITTSNAQNKKSDKPKEYRLEKQSAKNPNVNIAVNKKYDSKGNLIQFDSTYTYFRSPLGKDSAKVALDSVFNKFKLFYRENFPGIVDESFSTLFLRDSLFKYDFLNDDFFRKRVELNTQIMNEMFREMDSLKNNFLKEPPKKKLKLTSQK